MLYRFDGIELDTDVRELRQAGEPVHVEPQVFDVLAYLIEHRERLVAKDELLERVWGDNFVSDAAVNSRLMSARRAIGDNGREQRLIRTLHGRGFRFVGDVSVPGADETPAEPARADASPPVAATMPAQLTPLIGREKELADLHRLLEDESCRLLTLTGPGGIGKTRLASELARGLTQKFRDGVFLVPLQPVSLADFLVPAIADAIGLTLRGQEGVDEQLFAHLQDRQALLLLDNFEHLVESADLLSGLLAHTRSVKLIVTSREALNLREEWVFPLAGLSFPAMENSADDPDGGEYDAVRLFRERGRRAARTLSTPEELRAIARIARLVEGMPLAIELAASWLRSMSVDDIVTEIERSRDFLSTSMRDVPERHRSMRAIFDESWRLLSDDERDVLGKLSVFRGSFERAAANEVAGAGASLLSALVDKSLLKPAGSGRYQLHEVLRQYSEEQLAANPGDAEMARDRHCDYYLDLLSRCFERAMEGEQLRLTAEVEAELENIRAAWVRAIEHPRFEALQTAGQALSLFYQWKGRYSEAVADMDRGVSGLRHAARTPAEQVCLATLLTHQAWSFMRIGKLDETSASAEEAAAIYQRLGVLPAHGSATDPVAFRGVVATMRGDYAGASAAGDEARQNAERQGSPWNLAIAHYVLTRSAILQGRHREALDYAEKALKAAQSCNDNWFQAYCLVELGNVMAALQDHASARTYYSASYKMRREFGDPEGMALALTYLGELSLKQGLQNRALEEFNESLHIYEALNDKGGLASALNGLAAAARATGDLPAARLHYARSLPIVAEMSFVPLLLGVTLGVGDLLARSGDTEAAAVLLRVALRHPASDSDTQSTAGRLFSSHGLTLPGDDSLQEEDIEKASSILEAALSLPPSRSLAPLTPLLRGSQPREQGVGRSAYPDDLTEREVDVLKLIAQGRTNREIADELFISVNTAANHVKSILSKTSAANRTEAAAYAIESGLHQT